MSHPSHPSSPPPRARGKASPAAASPARSLHATAVVKAVHADLTGELLRLRRGVRGADDVRVLEHVAALVAALGVCCVDARTTSPLDALVEGHRFAHALSRNAVYGLDLKQTPLEAALLSDRLIVDGLGQLSWYTDAEVEEDAHGNDTRPVKEAPPGAKGGGE